MANEFIKAERIVRTALGLLEREVVLPRLVWRDAGGDFKGAKNDTISIRLPAYAVARTRNLRGGTPITMDELDEAKVDVTLSTDVYKAVPISDEELTLDIEDFGFQVLGPVVRSVARGVEDQLSSTITGGSYHKTINVDDDVADDAAYPAIVDARKALNDARVPMGGRTLLVGSSVEALILKSDRFVRVDSAGARAEDALSESMIGRIAGFNVVPGDAIPPDQAFAFHQTAYVLSSRAPMVPEGATFGASESFAGLAMRVIRDYDFLNVRDRLLADTFMGANTVADDGYFDANGKFQPNLTPGEDTLAITGEADTEVITTDTAHGLSVGDVVTVDGLTGGAGLTEGRVYYVASTPSGTTLTVSETSGGAAVNFTTDVTAGTLGVGGLPLFVRAVKLALVSD